MIKSKKYHKQFLNDQKIIQVNNNSFQQQLKKKLQNDKLKNRQRMNNNYQQDEMMNQFDFGTFTKNLQKIQKQLTFFSNQNQSQSQNQIQSQKDNKNNNNDKINDEGDNINSKNAKYKLNCSQKKQFNQNHLNNFNNRNNYNNLLQQTQKKNDKYDQNLKNVKNHYNQFNNRISIISNEQLQENIKEIYQKYLSQRQFPLNHQQKLQILLNNNYYGNEDQKIGTELSIGDIIALFQMVYYFRQIFNQEILLQITYKAFNELLKMENQLQNNNMIRNIKHPEKIRCLCELIALCGVAEQNIIQYFTQKLLEQQNSKRQNFQFSTNLIIPFELSYLILTNLGFKGLQALINLSNKELPQKKNLQILDKLCHSQFIIKNTIIPYLLADLTHGNAKQKSISLAVLNRLNNLVGQDQRVLKLIQDMIKKSNSSMFNNNQIQSQKNSTLSIEKGPLVSVLRSSGIEGQRILLKLAKNKKYQNNERLILPILSILSWRVRPQPIIRLKVIQHSIGGGFLPGTLYQYQGSVQPSAFQFINKGQICCDSLCLNSTDFLTALNRLLRMLRSNYQSKYIQQREEDNKNCSYLYQEPQSLKSKLREQTQSITTKIKTKIFLREQIFNNKQMFILYGLIKQKDILNSKDKNYHNKTQHCITSLQQQQYQQRKFQQEKRQQYFKQSLESQQQLQNSIEISQDVVKTIQSFLNNKIASIRQAALNSIGLIGLPQTERSIEKVSKLLWDSESNVRSMACWTLSKLFNKKAINNKKISIKIVQRLSQLLRDNFWKVRTSACITISTIIQQPYQCILQNLLKCLKDGSINKFTICECFIAIGRIGQQILLQLLKTAGINDFKLKQAIINSFKLIDFQEKMIKRIKIKNKNKLGHKSIKNISNQQCSDITIDLIIQEIFKHCKSKDSKIQIRALCLQTLNILRMKYIMYCQKYQKYFNNIQCEESNKENINFLNLKTNKEKNFKQQRSYNLSLIQIPYLQAQNILPLYYFFLEDPSPKIRQLAIQSILSFGSQAQLIFIQGLTRGTPLVRCQSAKALGILGTQNFRALILGLKDDDQRVIKTSCQSLLLNFTSEQVYQYFLQKQNLIPSVVCSLKNVIQDLYQNQNQKNNRNDYESIIMDTIRLLKQILCRFEVHCQDLQPHQIHKKNINNNKEQQDFQLNNSNQFHSGF